MYLVSQELSRGAELADEMLDQAKESLTGTNRKEARVEFAASCSALERLQKYISQYLTKMLSSGSMTEVQAEKQQVFCLYPITWNVLLTVRRYSADCEKDIGGKPPDV